MATINNSNQSLLVNDMKVRMHVFEPEESVNSDSWYKDLTTFKHIDLPNNFKYYSIGDVVEDDMGARFRILSRHWKWESDTNGQSCPLIEFTVERYIRRGKQNPYMI